MADPISFQAYFNVTGFTFTFFLLYIMLLFIFFTLVRKSFPISIRILSISLFVSWLQYYPTPDLSHVYWALVPTTALFLYLVSISRKYYFTIVANCELDSERVLFKISLQLLIILLFFSSLLLTFRSRIIHLRETIYQQTVSRHEFSFF